MQWLTHMWSLLAQLAPRLISSLTYSSLPSQAAMCRGVLPLWSWPFTSAPSAAKYCTQAFCWAATALCKALQGGNMVVPAVSACQGRKLAAHRDIHTQGICIETSIHTMVNTPKRINWVLITIIIIMMMIVMTWDLPAGFSNKHQHAHSSSHNKLRQAQEMH